MEDDFQLVCWDFVSNPSTHGAFLQVNESINKQVQDNYSKAEMLIHDMTCELSGQCCID